MGVMQDMNEAFIKRSQLMDQAFSKKGVEECGEFTFPGEGVKTVYLQDDGSGYYTLEIDEAAGSWSWVDVTETVCVAGGFEIQQIQALRQTFEARPTQLDHNASAAFAREVLGESY